MWFVHWWGKAETLWVVTVCSPRQDPAFLCALGKLTWWVRWPPLCPERPRAHQCPGWGTDTSHLWAQKSSEVLEWWIFSAWDPHGSQVLEWWSFAPGGGRVARWHWWPLPARAPAASRPCCGWCALWLSRSLSHFCIKLLARYLEDYFKKLVLEIYNQLYQSMLLTSLICSRA